MKHLIPQCILLFLCVSFCKGGAYGTREDPDLDELEGVLMRELRDELVNDQKKIKDNVLDNALDDEGLTKLRQKAATHDMTPNGDKTNKDKLPKAKDLSCIEEEIQAGQEWLRGGDGKITDEKLRQLLLTTTCTCRSSSGDKKPARSHCPKVEKRQYRRLSNVEKRKYSGDTSRIWEKGIIPYKFDTSREETEEGKKQILKAMKYMQAISCLEFVEYTAGIHQQYGLTHDTYLNFINSGGCYSFVGRVMSGAQDIAACSSFEVALHEILHALAGIHEQERADRDPWIEILSSNIESGKEFNFEHNTKSRVFDTKYDYGSVMQYGLTSFSKKPNSLQTMAIYDSDLRFLMGKRHGGLSHSDKMALNRAYKCKESKCPSFSKVCKNGGFVGYSQKQCKCVCSNGLMGDTCEDIYQPTAASIPTEWPKDTYGLPQPTTGCPSGSWTTGNRYQTTKFFSYTTTGLHVKSDSWGNEYMNHQFCMRGAATGNPATWSPGNYCIYKKGNCPSGFTVGEIQFDDADSNNKNSVNGAVPDGSFGSDTKFYYCCRDDGMEDVSIKLPLTKPFYLFMPNTAQTCQQVEGAAYTAESFHFEEGNNAKHSTKGLYAKLNTFVKDSWNRYRLYYCYYEPKNYACGGKIVLTDANSVQYVKSPNYPRNYDHNRQCVWLITSPADTQIQVAMEDFEVEDDGKGTCIDSLEIRHHIIAEPGPRYCGTHFKRSLTSNFNSMMLIFRSTATGSKKGFNAKLSIVKKSRYTCYNKADLGRTYVGKVSYTRDYKKCVSWAAAATCPEALWNPHILALGTGDHNYCRNPSGAEQPWCYVNTTTCEMGLCDVCGINQCYDKVADCASKKTGSAGFCATDEGFSNCHKTCGHCGKDRTNQVTSCPQPPTPTYASLLSGSLKTSYNVGESVKYKCTTGFGVHSRFCLTDGTWSGTGRICGACPPEWTADGKSCFRAKEETLTWEDADSACKALTSNLASPANSLQETLIESLVLDSKPAWIGYNDKQTEGTWKWSDGSSSSFTFWDSGQPDNENEQQNCALIQYAKMGENNINRRWNDQYCYHPYSYICEGNLGNVCADTRTDCAQLKTKYPNMCTYKAFRSSECRRTCGQCDQNDKDIETITTTASTTKATTTTTRATTTTKPTTTTTQSTTTTTQPTTTTTQTTTTTTQPTTTTTQSTTTTTQPTTTTTQTTTTTTQPTTTTTQSTTTTTNPTTTPTTTQPTSTTTTEATTTTTQSTTTSTTTQPSSTTTATSSGSCKQSWSKHGSSCYKIFNGGTRNFNSAKNACKQNGGYLVQISNAAESSFIKNQLKKVKRTFGWWIGLTDQKIEGTFRWTKDDSTATYTDWISSFPSRSRRRNCVFLYRYASYRWFDYACSYRLPYICEYDLSGKPGPGERKQILGQEAKYRSNMDSWTNTAYIPEPHKQVACSGYVTAWEVYFRRAATMYLQIWRAQGNKRYLLVGETMVYSTRGAKTFNLRNSQRIAVQKGDVLGFYFAGKNPIPFDGRNCNKDYMLFERTSAQWTYAGESLVFRSKQGYPMPCRHYSVQAIIKKDSTSCTTKREISQRTLTLSLIKRFLKKKKNATA